MYSLQYFRFIKNSNKLKFLINKKYYSKNNSPFYRTAKIFANDFTDLKNLIFKTPIEKRSVDKCPNYCDVLIIGGGVMGSSTAFWLKQRTHDGLSVMVIEKDLSYRSSSTVLSVGGLRQQFSLKENIQLSLHSADFFRNVKHLLQVPGNDPPDIQFTPTGYLFIASEKSAKVLEANHKLQTELGAKVELLTPKQIKKKFPWINTDGVALACHGLENEGWFDPWSLLTAFRRKAISLGATYVEGEVVEFISENNSSIVTPNRNYKPISEAVIRFSEGEEFNVTFGTLVIAAGAQSGEVAKLIASDVDLSLPVEPRKRYVYNIHCPDGPGLNCPMIIDYSGAYIRREGLAGNYLCGRSPLDDSEPDVDNLEVDYDFFQNNVWPIIADRAPCFNNAKLKSAWAGFYEYNRFDENGFVGPHPGFHNVYLATGFSGHGIQQSPAVGRALMEAIIDGCYSTIDLTRFHFDRVLKNEPLWESNIV